jgi:hypothetical protein
MLLTKSQTPSQQTRPFKRVGNHLIPIAFSPLIFWKAIITIIASSRTRVLDAEKRRPRI